MAEISKYPEIETCDYHNLKLGKDFVLSDGYILKNEVLTTPPSKPVSYAFCSDTRYWEEVVSVIENVDVLYHEATFLHDLKEMADYTGPVSYTHLDVYKRQFLFRCGFISVWRLW